MKYLENPSTFNLCKRQELIKWNNNLLTDDQNDQERAYRDIRGYGIHYITCHLLDAFIQSD